MTRPSRALLGLLLLGATSGAVAGPIHDYSDGEFFQNKRDFVAAAEAFERAIAQDGTETRTAIGPGKDRVPYFPHLRLAEAYARIPGRCAEGLRALAETRRQGVSPGEEVAKVAAMLAGCQTVQPPPAQQRPLAVRGACCGADGCKGSDVTEEDCNALGGVRFIAGAASCSPCPTAAKPPQVKPPPPLAREEPPVAVKPPPPPPPKDIVACCGPDGCEDLPREECEENVAFDSSYRMVAGRTCASAPCRVEAEADAAGACCVGGECLTVLEDKCDSLNGAFMGSGVACDGQRCAGVATAPRGTATVLQEARSLLFRGEGDLRASSRRALQSLSERTWSARDRGEVEKLLALASYNLSELSLQAEPGEAELWRQRAVAHRDSAVKAGITSRTLDRRFYSPGFETWFGGARE